MSNQRTYYVDGLQRKDEYDRNCAVKPGMMVSSTYLPQVRVVALRTRARASLVVKSQHDWHNLDVRGYWAFSILGPLYGTPAVPGQEFWPGRDDMRHQTYNIYLYNTPTYRRYLGSGHSAGRISASCSRCSADQVTAITQRHGVANATEKSSLSNSFCTEMITLFVEHQLFTNRFIIEIQFGPMSCLFDLCGWQQYSCSIAIFLKCANEILYFTISKWWVCRRLRMTHLRPFCVCVVTSNSLDGSSRFTLRFGRLAGMMKQVQSLNCSRMQFCCIHEVEIENGMKIGFFTFVCHPLLRMMRNDPMHLGVLVALNVVLEFDGYFKNTEQNC